MAETEHPDQASTPMTLRLDESKLRTTCSNAFRTNGTVEELLLDFGINSPNPSDPDEVLMHIQTRVILSYFSAKRLALALGQAIQHHEQQFGELELDPSKRRN